MLSNLLKEMKADELEESLKEFKELAKNLIDPETNRKIC